MTKKKILTILSFLLLFGCGYEPLYSKKKIDNIFDFSINSIGFSGENLINQNIKNNLQNYINVESKTIKYDLIINSKKIITVTSKNKKGNPETFYIKLVIILEVQKNNESITKKTFEDGFEYKNKSNKLELKRYEESIIKNLSKKMSETMIQQINSIE